MNLKTGLNGDINLDSKGKRNQIIQTKKLARRLTNPTFFEVVGWKRISFFPKALEEFGFDPDSAELNFEEIKRDKLILKQIQILDQLYLYC